MFSADCFPAARRNKPKPSKVLMLLILAMYINQTALEILQCYLDYLAFVKSSGLSEDQADDMVVSFHETPLTVLNILAVIDLLTSVTLGIADSIMVDGFRSYLLSDSNVYLGVALLDHL